MDQKITYQKIWNIAWPIILGSVAQNIIAVTDTAFLGRVGEVALGASAIGGIFYLAITMLGWGFGIGTQIIVSRRFGERNKGEIGAVVEHALYFLVPVSIILFLVMHFFSDVFLGFLLQSENIHEASKQFLDYRLFGIFFAFVNMAFRALYIGIGRTKIITFTTAAMALVNVFMDYVLIFGKMGFAAHGIEGAAIASVLAEIAATVTFIIYIKFDRKLVQYNIFRFQTFSRELYFRIIRVSTPVMFQNFFSISVWFMFFVFVESMGEHSLAISNIIRSVYVVLMLPIWGFASATNTLVSRVIGQGRPEEVLKVISKVIHLSFFSVLLIVGIIIISPESVLLIYTNDLSLVKDSISVLYVVSGSSLVISTGFILFNGVSGTGKTNISMLLELGALVAYLAYSYSLLKFFNASITQIWTAEYVYGFLLMILSYLYLRSGKWKGSKI